MVEEEVGEIRGTVVVAGRVEGRHEVVVEVVIAPENHYNYGFGQVPTQSCSIRHCSHLAQCGLKIQHLLAQAKPLSLHRSIPHSKHLY